MLKKIKNYFLSGLVVFLPLALTVYLIFLAMNFAEGIFGKFLKPIFAENFGFYFSGLSIIMGVYVIVVIGFLVTHFIGKKSSCKPRFVFGKAKYLFCSCCCKPI